MANLLNIEFKPCPAEHNATYKVRYRRNAQEGYTTYAGTFLTSPILIGIAGDPVTQQYEGFLDVYQNGVAGAQVPFVTKSK